MKQKKSTNMLRVCHLRVGYKLAVSLFFEKTTVTETDTMIEHTTAVRSTVKHGGVSVLIIIITLPISLIPAARAEHYFVFAPEPLQPANITLPQLKLSST